MPRFRSLDPALSPLHFFGAELRRAREAAGLTLAEFGALVPCDKPTASRVESGFTVPDEAYVLAADRAFPEAGGWFGRFYEAHFGWGVAYPPEFRSFVPDEARASALYVFEHSLLPGLLATEAYAREVLTRTLNVSEQLVNERVAARLARQAVLDRTDPPLLYWAVLDDAVLSRCVGGAEVMRETRNLFATGLFSSRLWPVSAWPGPSLVRPVSSPARPGPARRARRACCPGLGRRGRRRGRPGCP